MRNKVKVKKAVKARFKVTGTGKLMRNRQGRRHLLTKKSSNRKRRLKKSVVLVEGYQKTYTGLIQGM